MLNRVLNSGICSEFPAWRWLRMTWCGSHKARGWLLGVIYHRFRSQVRDVRWLHVKRFPRFNFGASLMRSPQIANASLWLTFVINHPSQFSIWVALLVVQWYTAAATGRRSWRFACFKGKKAQFQVHPRFPFHPTRGGSLKVIFSSSFGLGFALSRTREMQTLTVSTLHSLIMGEKEQSTY